MSDPRELLRMFADGEGVSGEAMAARLGVTRAAVWKQVDALRRRGLPIEGQAGSGYRLPWPVQLLDIGVIRKACPTYSPALLELHWELDSTSSEMQRRLDNLPDLSVILAESQHTARGRRGRGWVSPPALNIYLSCLKRFDAGFAALSGLSLAVGVALMRTLDELGIRGAGLKWPNDVLAHDAKLAGILVELSGECEGPCCAVIGIGLNVRMPQALRQQTGQAVTDLADLTAGAPPPRNRIAGLLITQLRDCLGQFEREGFALFDEDYCRFDLLRDQPLRVSAAHGTFDGYGAGIDARGALRVRTRDGERVVDSAEVTVRQRVPSVVQA